MSEMSDSELDETLARHLRDRLDPQVGRGLKTFERELASERKRSRRRVGFWSGSSVAAAAVIAFVYSLLPAITTPRKATTPVDRQVAVNGPATSADAIPVVESAEWSGVVDDGTAVVNDRPVRRLRQRMVEEVEWYDPAHRATVRTTIPRERIVLIGMKTD
jgi:hypothetical protein